jgi:hypothetical protein
LASGEMFKHDGRMTLFSLSPPPTLDLHSLARPSPGSGPSLVSRFSRSPNSIRSPMLRAVGHHRSPGARSPAGVMARARGAVLSPSPSLAAANRSAGVVPPLSLRSRPTPPSRDTLEAVGPPGRALLEEVATTTPVSVSGTWFAEFGGLLPGLAPSRSRGDLCQRVARKWRRRAKLGLGCRTNSLAERSSAPPWVATLIFSSSSAEVRQLAASLLQVKQSFPFYPDSN